MVRKYGWVFRAHFIEILNPDGTILVRHKREYGDARTDTSDYSTTLEVLSGIPGHGETVESVQMHRRYCVIIWIP